MRKKKAIRSDCRCFSDGSQDITEQNFLIYGLNKEWLFEHPEIKDADVKEQYELVHAGGGIVSHAHPFREEDYIPEIRLFPGLCRCSGGNQCYT